MTKHGWTSKACHIYDEHGAVVGMTVKPEQAEMIARCVNGVGELVGIGSEYRKTIASIGHFIGNSIILMIEAICDSDEVNELIVDMRNDLKKIPEEINRIDGVLGRVKV